MQNKLILIVSLSFLTADAQQRSSCSLPLALVDVSHANAVVGTGAPASCAEQALQNAILIGGIITFNCGAQPVVIPITSTHTFRDDVDTVLDGGKTVTLQGNGSTRLFLAESGVAPWYGGTPPFYQSTRTSVTLQNMTFTNGRSSGTPLPALPPGASQSCSQGTEFDGGGGVIYVRDMVLHVINSTFLGNHAAPLGPDVAGGAIYALGSIETIIQGSLFQGNDGANGGAIGMLESNFQSVNTIYRNNRALGHDGNHDVPSSGCPIHLNQYQIGDGGNAGAVYLDGQGTQGPVVCGDLYGQNHGGVNAIGGAIFAAGDPGIQYLTVAQTQFNRNSSNNGGAIYLYKNQVNLSQSTFFGNTAAYGGAIQGDLSNLTATNNTFSGNSASINIGVLALFGGSGSLTNNTFAGNSAPHFPVLFDGDSSSPVQYPAMSNNLFVSNVATGHPLPCFKGFPGSGNLLWPPVNLSPAPEGACALRETTADPLLGTLAYNGGFTRTMSIPASSPANNLARPCPATDQRGVPRPLPCASGAFQP